jgi:hypothetical protein
MESAWLRLGSGPRPGSRRSVWVFLAPGRFAAKTPSHERWIVLDFLGLSRPNRDFSTGYEPLSGEKSIARFSRGVRGAGTGACGRRHAEAQDCSWGKLTLVSDFQQLIVVRAVPFRPPQSRTTRSKGELPPNPFRFSSTAAKRFFGAAKKQRSSIELQGVRRLISGPTLRFPLSTPVTPAPWPEQARSDFASTRFSGHRVGGLGACSRRGLRFQLPWVRVFQDRANRRVIV